MIVINFSHPLNSSQKQKIEELSQRPIQKIIDVPFQLDNQQPFTEQVGQRVMDAGISSLVPKKTKYREDNQVAIIR